MKTKDTRSDDVQPSEPAARPVRTGGVLTGTAAEARTGERANDLHSSPRMQRQAARLASFSGQQASTLAPAQRLAAQRYDLRPAATVPGPAGSGTQPLTVQAKSYTTAPDTNRRRLRGGIDVTTGTGEVRIAGSLKDTDDKDVPVTGTVYTPEYFVDHAQRTVPPVPGASRSLWESFWKPANALRVQNVTADPRGMKLGQLMTHEVALEALRRGKSHVIAMSVSDARGPFYTPLGFGDYDTSKPWQDLKRQHDEIANYLHSPAAANLSAEAIRPSAQHMADLKEEMSNSAMIIDSATLRDNSRDAFVQTWRG